MEKLRISFEHYYEDGVKAFHGVYEFPVTNSEDSIEIIHKVKSILREGGKDNFGDCNTEDLAGIFNVTQNTIMNWVKRDGMPIVIKSSKGYRFNKEDVFEWVKSHKAHYIYLIQRYEQRTKSQK